MISPSFVGNRHARGRLFVGLALVAPVVLVVAARFLIGLSPSQSHAAVPDAAPAPTDPVTRALTPSQRKLVAYIALSTSTRAVVTSPMDQVPAPQTPPVTQTPAPAPAIVATPAIEARPAAQLMLSAIMAGANPASALVMISGKVYRLGEDVTPGWTLTKIDAQSLTITLRGTDNQEFTLARDPR